MLAFLGFLYRSFTSGKIRDWLSSRGEMSGECRTVVKNTAPVKNDCGCEMTIDDKRRVSEIYFISFNYFLRISIYTIIEYS